MRIAGIIKNDFSAAPGVCLTVFVQGCDIHCPGCHNPGLQDFNGGREYTLEIQDSIIKGLTANGVHRSLCIMGGEPLCLGNVLLTNSIIKNVKEKLPQTKIYIWTGYTYENLLRINSPSLYNILHTTDYLIDGPYKQEERDITLNMRGSTNQRIIDLKTGKDVTNEFE